MTLDNRSMHLLSILQQSPTALSMKQLVEQMNVSQRSIYYDMERINDWLEGKSLQPIQNKRGKGFYLESETKETLNQPATQKRWTYHFSSEERRLLISTVLLLQPENTSMNHWMELTGVSRGTVAKDVKAIKQDLNEAGLYLHYKKNVGYRLDGSEETKRRYLSDIFTTVLAQSESENIRNEIQKIVWNQQQESQADEMNRETVKRLLYQTEEDIGMTFTDAMMEVLSLQVVILLRRIKENQLVSVNQEEKAVLHETAAYQGAVHLSQRLQEHFDVQIPEEETYFLTMALLGSKVHHDEFPERMEEELKGLRQVIQRMIRDFQTYACVVFDQTKELENNLMAHLKPTYYRLKYGVNLSNEWSNQIQEKYSEIYRLTERTIYHLEYYVGKKIPEEEIAYIAIHFGGWLTREKKQVETQYKAVIVCENGIGTSNMVKTQLENMIIGLEITDTLSIREFHQFTEPVDVIFSTNYIKPKDTPVIHVPVIMKNQDKEHVLEQMNELFTNTTSELTKQEQLMSIIDQHATVHNRAGLKEELSQFFEQKTSSVKEPDQPMLTELLVKENLLAKDRVSNWEEAIRIAAAPLLEQQSIEKSYVEAMIDTVHELGPYIVIAPRIAIPHARPEAGVNRLSMSLLRLKEPVWFSEKEKHKAQLVFVLAAIDNQTHLKALSQLTEILSNEENITKLIEMETNEEVMELIQSQTVHQN
ncbi:BglG family transcription antiterminator [Halobacillus locisalis]|uniref:BglG family transcription antiterminator n=1 Tax=Halobacillus locisalis TaxID=220753 RepID=A0A838CUI6_9BACI|nr:BglG family transcription antiterminator [Halobacillus locisalis]MBA2175435.1 BglG family transcription antiterminator [Halobacillus locisalis]